MCWLYVAINILICSQSLAFSNTTPRNHARNNIERKDLADADDPLLSDSTTPQRHLVFPGGGIFFYWQAGYIDYLRQQHYDLSTSISMTGASAGALCATLTASDVDFVTATQLALDMARDAGVWDRQGGLQGIWSGMIRDWLDQLLPENAAERMQERQVSLLVTPLPSFGKHKVRSFHDKQDLIAANMASVHIPWFLDGKLVANFRDKTVMDGSFLSRPEDYAAAHDSQVTTLVLDYSQDPSLQQTNLLDAVTALSPDGIWGLLEQGRQFARQQDEQGLLASFPRHLEDR